MPSDRGEKGPQSGLKSSDGSGCVLDQADVCSNDIAVKASRRRSLAVRTSHGCARQIGSWRSEPHLSHLRLAHRGLDLAELSAVEILPGKTHALGM